MFNWKQRLSMTFKVAILITTATLAQWLSPPVSIAQITITTNPTKVLVVEGKTTTVSVTHTVFSNAGSIILVNSSLGRFTTNGGSTFIGTNNFPFSGGGPVGVDIPFTETITITPALINQAILNGVTTFEYQRVINGSVIVTSLPAEGTQYASVVTGPGFPLTTSVQIVIGTGSETVGPLALRRVDLFFKEEGRRKSEVTVRRNTRGLKAYADVELSGSGYLEGSWEVDGRVIENVRKYVSYGRKVTLSTSDVPGISTFTPGFHSVQFKVKNPSSAFTLPRIAYFVTAAEKAEVEKIAMNSPPDGEEVSKDTEFAWETTKRAVAYVAAFTRQFDGKIILSAMVRKNDYSFPEALYADRFVPGTRYIWQVTGYDGNGIIVSESDKSEFTAR